MRDLFLLVLRARLNSYQTAIKGEHRTQIFLATDERVCTGEGSETPYLSARLSLPEVSDLAALCH